MYPEFKALSKRLDLLEVNINAIKLIKPRYYLHSAQDKLSQIFGESVDIWDVIDLANEAKQPLWLDLDECLVTGGCYELKQVRRDIVHVGSQEYSNNPFLNSELAFDSIKCVKFSNGIDGKLDNQIITCNKALPQYIYLERSGLSGIIHMF